MFVFGFRSNKIRSKDLRSLIHNSEAHKNVDKCTVEVHFIQIIDDVCILLSWMFGFEISI